MSATKNFRTDLTAANRGALRSATALGRVLTVAAAATAMGADGVKAGPKGGAVKAGAATITTRGGTTTINQAGQKVVIDWDSFDIDAKEAVNFLQPGKDSIALNRVLNDLPTNIRGQLTANGNVWIVNQHGVTFHAGAVVNVGSLIATTADIDNADFMAGNYKFDKPGDPNAKIINEGDITFGEAGLAAFVAPSATNRGVIAGRMGKVVIAGNETFAVDLAGDGMWAFTMGEGANGASAANSGRIHNPGGYILISARAAQGMVDSNISVGGVVEATTAKVEGGKIVLSGDGFVEVAGSLDATGAEAGQVGGSIEITGDKVHVTATAKIDASGDAGGGAIKIGGDYQGGGTLKTASRTLVSEGAEIKASAIGQVGDGGEVIVWADEITGFFGSIQATGGANAGHGGFAEVSGKRQLAFDGMVDLSARNGLPGTLLLDPDEIIISAVGTDDAQLGDGQILFGEGGAYSTFYISTGAIQTQLDAGTDVLLQANDSITLEAGNPITATGAGDLTLIASSYGLYLNSNITIAGDLSLTTGGFIAPGAGVTLSARDVGLFVNGGLALGSITASRDLTVQSASGGVTDAADETIDVTGATSITAQRDILLDNATNVFGGAVSLSGEDIQLTGTSDLTLGAITANANGADTLIAGDGDVMLGGGAIVFGGALTSVDDLTVNAAGMVSQGAAISITGDLDVNAAGQTVSLNSGSNDFQGAVNVSAGSLHLSDVNALKLNDLDLSAYSAITAGTAITQGIATGAGDAIDAAEVSLTASSGAITLGNTSNDFGSVQTSATGSVLLGDRSGVILQSQGFTGSLTVNATGDITDDDNFTLTLTGPVYLIAGTGAIAFDNDNLDFQGVVEASGASVSLDDNNNLAIGAITALTGAASLSADDTLTINAGKTVQGDTVALAANAVVNSGTITATDAGVDIDATTTVTSAGQINATTPAAVVDVDAGGAIQVAGINAAGVSLATTSGDITQTGGTIATTEASDFTATGSVTINSVTNDFEGPVGLAGTQALVRDVDGLELGDVNVATLTVNASGSVTQDAMTSLTVTASTSITTTDDILLANTANAVAGGLTLSGGDINLDAGGNVTLNAITASDAANDATIAGAGDVTISGGTVAFASSPVGVNDLDVTATGGISQTAAISITGDADLSAPMSQINLTNANNDFQGQVDATASAVTLYDVNNLELGLINVDTLSANAGGDITDQGSKIEARNFAGFTATGDINIDALDTHVFTSGVDLSADQIIRFAATGTLSLGSVTTGDVLSVENRITATDGITLDGAISTAGVSDLTLETTNGDILKRTGSLTTDVLTVDTGTGDATFITPTIDVNTLRVTSGGNVSLTTPDGLTIGDVDAVTLIISAGDAIDQEAASSIVLGGLADFTTTGDTVTLTETWNNFGSVAVDTSGGMSTASDVEITDANGLALGDISAASLTIIAGGAITQTGAIDATANSSFTATGDITLTDATNDFADTGSGTTAAFSGATVFVTDFDTLALGNVASSASATITADDAGASGSFSGGLTELRFFDTDGDMVLSSALVLPTTVVNFTADSVGAVDAQSLTLPNAATLLDATTSVTFSTGAGSFAALTVNAPDGVYQTAAITVSGATDLNAPTSQIDLGNGANDFQGRVDADGSAVTLYDANSLEIALINSDTLIANAGGDITDQGAKIEARNFASFTAQGDITIDMLDTHVFNSSVALSADQITRFAAKGLFSFSAITATNTNSVTNRITVTGGATLDGAISTAGLSDLTLDTTDANILQNSGSLATDVLTLNLGTGDGTFIAGVNDVNTLTAPSATNVALTDTDGLTIGTVDATTLTVTAGGEIDQQAMSTVTLTGLATLTTAGQNITLAEASNDFAVIDADGGDLTFHDATGVELADIDATGALTVEALGGDITDGATVATPAGSDVNVAGTTALTATGAITMDDATNNFGGAVSASGAAVTLRDANGVILGDIDASGALIVEAVAGAITQNGDGAVGEDIDALATATFTATDAITLTDASNDFRAGVNATGGAISLVDLNAIELADIGAGGLSVTAASIDDGAAGADVNVTGETALTASTTITLDDATNDFGGAVSASGTAITLRDANSIILSDIDAGGVLTVEATAGAISQDGDGLAGEDINAAAEANFTAATTITLTDASNDFGGVVNADGTGVAIGSLGELQLGDIDSTSLYADAATITDGATSLVAGGDVNVTGTTTLNAVGAILLNDATNDFGQAVSFNGQNVTLTDANNIVLGEGAAGGSLEVTAAGSITDSAGSAISVEGAATLTAEDGATTFDIALNNDTAADRHDFRGPVNAVGQDITLIDRSGITLGTVTTNGGAADNTINVDGGAEATDPGELVVIARGGAIEQDAASILTIAGDTTLEAADGAGGYFDITLTNTQNAFDSDNADAVGDGDTTADSVTFLGETVAITDTGPFFVFDSVANAGGVLTSQTGELTIAQLRVNAAAGPLVGIAANGAIDADDLSGGSITLGGAGSADGAATAASGAVTVDKFTVGALSVASDVSTTLTNGDAGGGLKVAAPLQTFTFVTADAFTDGVATDFNALTGSTADQLILERIAFDVDITIAAGDVDLGHIDADDGFSVTALTGDVSKRADADLDFGGSATTGFTVAGARGAADQTVTSQSFDTLLRVGGEASFTATSGDVVITRGQTGSGVKEVDLQGIVSIAATDAAIEDQNSLVLGQVSVDNDFAIRINTDNAGAAAETLTQTDTQTITVGGDLALITGLGVTDRSDVLLTTAGNNLNTVSALADDVSIVSGTTLTFRNSDLTGDLTLGSGGGLTIQDVQADGDMAFDAAGATTLNRLNVNGVTGQSGGSLTAAELLAGGAVDLTTTGGDLTVTDAIIGAFDFDSAGALIVANLSTAGSEGGLSTAVDDISIANIVSASNASFDSTGGALDIDSARIGSTLTLSASGNVTLGAIATGADLSATSDTASVLIRDGAGEAPADIVVDGAQDADIGFASGPLVGDLADDRIIETVVGAAGQTVDPADFTLQLAIGGDAAFDAAGSILLPREAATEGGFQNDFMGDVALSAATGDVVIEDANALSFATVTITAGDLTARSNADNIGTGEGITQTAAIAVGGYASFITGDHGDNDGGAAIADEAILADVTLGSQANDFTGAVSVIAANAALADANSITVANSRVANVLTIDATAAGAANTAALTDVQSGGATTVTSGGSVDLDQLVVGGALAAAGQGAGLTANDIDVTGGTTLSAATTLVVGDAILADATITAGASGALSDVSAQVINVQTGGVTISGLSATTTTIASTGPADIEQISTAATTITATDGSLTLSQAEIDGPLDAVAGADITIDTTQIDGDAAILSTGGDIGFGSVAVSGRLTAESAAGAIRTIESEFATSPASTPNAASPPAGDAAPDTLITVGGDAYFLAAGDVVLVDDAVGEAANDFMSGVTAISGGSVILSDANDLILGAPIGVAKPGGGTFTTTGITAADSLRVEVGGSITDADAPQAVIEIGGDAFLRAGGDILLDNETHIIGGAIAARGRNITLTEVGSINLGPINASGDLMVEAGANNDAQGGTLGDAAIIQDHAVDVANAVIGENIQVETIRGAIEVVGVSTFATGLAPGFALDNPQVTGVRDLVLDSPANQFGGRLNVARIAGDATITENSQPGATSGDQTIGNFEIGGTTRLTTTDNIVFIGRMSSLADEDTPDGLPTRPDGAEVRNQGNLNIADEDLHLFIATGEALIIDTRGGDVTSEDGTIVKVNPAGADVRFDRFVDGDNDVLPLGSPSITKDREGLGGLTINAGADGEIRFRDFVGAVHPLGDVSLSAGDIFAGFTFESLQPDLLTANFTPDNRFLFDRLAQDDFFFARNLEVKAQGRIEFLTPFRTVENFILFDQYFGVNIAGLVFGGLEIDGMQVDPEIVQSFGFIGNDRSRATGLFPRGPQGGNFQFNDCVIGDVADCTNVPIPNVINNILTPAPPLLGIDTEDLLELFGSFGNEELWGVPQSYYSDLGVEQENKPDCPKGSDDTDCSGS